MDDLAHGGIHKRMNGDDQIGRVFGQHSADSHIKIRRGRASHQRHLAFAIHEAIIHPPKSGVLRDYRVDLWSKIERWRGILPEEINFLSLMLMRKFQFKGLDDGCDSATMAATRVGVKEE